MKHLSHLIVLLKHMSGKHPQKTHAGKGKGVNVRNMIKSKKGKSFLSKGAQRIGKKMFGPTLVYNEPKTYKVTDARKVQLDSAKEHGGGVTYGQAAFVDEHEYMFVQDPKTGKTTEFSAYMDKRAGVSPEDVADFYADKKNTGKVLASYSAMDSSINVFNPKMRKKPGDSFVPKPKKDTWTPPPKVVKPTGKAPKNITTSNVNKKVVSNEGKNFAEKVQRLLQISEFNSEFRSGSYLSFAYDAENLPEHDSTVDFLKSAIRDKYIELGARGLN